MTLDKVTAALSYNPDSGEFVWKSREDRPKEWNTRRAGKVAGGLDAHGYRTIVIDKVQYKAHRLAWLCVYGRWPVGDIDHINRDKGDNRISNLRECTRTENNQNRAATSSNSASGYTGVSFCKTTNRWRAKIKADGKQIHLGRFDTREEARDAYLLAKGGLHPFMVSP